MKVKKESIIVIEKDDIHRSFLIRTLENQGYGIYEAANGLSGMKKVLDQKPDLIVCNTDLPDISGYDFVKEIRLLPETRFIPFIFISKDTLPADIRKGMNLGADDFITRDNNNEDLINAIDSRIKKRQREMELYKVEQNLFRQRVISMLPHEFNTPLVGILGGIKILFEQYEELKDKERKDLLEIAYDMTRRLERMSRNYTTYLKIEISMGDVKVLDHLTNGIVENTEKFIVQVTREECRNMMRPDDIEFNINIGECAISISNQNLKLLISEIINNALRYSEKGKKIILSAVISNGYLVIKIKDSGRGMTEQQISDIGAFIQFEREFYEQQGAGLGLILAKRLTEMHQGKFEITSKVNKGTAVTLFLPLFHGYKNL